MAKFCQNCGAPLEPNSKFCERCGTRVEQSVQSPPIQQQPVYIPQQPVYIQAPPVYIQQQPVTPAVSQKSQGVLFLLWFFGGFFGLHYFYAGRVGMGLIYLFTCGLFGIGWMVDFCTILGGTFLDESGKPIK